MSLPEYDQCLYEDPTRNRMSEALDLFSDITNVQWFADTPIILFLNKSDLLKVISLSLSLALCVFALIVLMCWCVDVLIEYPDDLC